MKMQFKRTDGCKSAVKKKAKYEFPEIPPSIFECEVSEEDTAKEPILKQINGVVWAFFMHDGKKYARMFHSYDDFQLISSCREKKSYLSKVFEDFK